ncbi:hypothetical protein [Massilia oculi]|uniref:hypothetical protein n=1 Tax=Massilia oculi TaxID=945844 RepID=UPI0028AE3FD0|nr:hypothetical protein [Massilia oculi]
MTLIAGYIINSCPVLLGDVLLSSSRSTGSSISLPSWHTDLKSPAEGDLKIVGMVQKVNIISDQACFAWAGSHIQAKVFARSLREHIKIFGLHHEDMITFLKAIDPVDRSDMQCILNTVHDGFLKRYHLDANEYECDGLMVQTGGTGVGHFLENIESFFKNRIDGDRREVNIVAPGLSYVASAFGEQIITGGGVSDGWGGAFEIAFYANGRFRKIDDVLYLFWTATELEDGSVVLESYRYVVKTNYFGDTFVVYVNDNSTPVPGTRIYNISPLGLGDAERHNPPMSFTYLVNYIFLEKMDGKTIAITDVRTKDSVSGFQLEHRDGAIHLEFSSFFLDELCTSAFGKGRMVRYRP